MKLAEIPQLRAASPAEKIELIDETWASIPRESLPAPRAHLTSTGGQSLRAAERPQGWQVYPFQAGTYLLNQLEFDSHWRVAGVFHALRDPEWILSQALIREAVE